MELDQSPWTSGWPSARRWPVHLPAAMGAKDFSQRMPGLAMLDWADVSCAIACCGGARVSINAGTSATARNNSAARAEVGAPASRVFLLFMDDLLLRRRYGVILV